MTVDKALMEVVYSIQIVTSANINERICCTGSESLLQTLLLSNRMTNFDPIIPIFCALLFIFKCPFLVRLPPSQYHLTAFRDQAGLEQSEIVPRIALRKDSHGGR